MHSGEQRNNDEEDELDEELQILKETVFGKELWGSES